MGFPTLVVNELRLPAFFILDPMEIPAQFQFNGPNDEKLNDLKKIQEFVDWVCNKFDLPKKQVNSDYTLWIKIYLKYMQNPEKAKKRNYLCIRT